MSISKYEDALEVPASDRPLIAFQELKEEVASLEQQRKHLNNQRALLDLEQADLEQQMAELQLQYAFLDALSTQLDQQEAMLSSDAEGIRMTGKRLSPRFLHQKRKRLDSISARSPIL
jgi:peptidoglycan hydrolase CwlO-like protein